MANPKVFVSSTWYDLRYIRENLKYFIGTLGYDPILNEEGSIFYDPVVNVMDACLHEIPNCQMFVLIIGGRHGANFKEDVKSITNHELLEARKLKIPVFALVEQSVLNDYYLYVANAKNSEVDAKKISYPSTDSTKIFLFIDEVQSGAINNALVPFRNFADIESYLRQQWAGMMFSFLSLKNEADRVNDTLSMLTAISARVEMLSTQILKSVGTPIAKLTAMLYDAMLQRGCIRDLAYMGASPKPEHVITQATYRKCFKAAGGGIMKIEDSKSISVGQHGRISRPKFERNVADYAELRESILELLTQSSVSPAEYLSSVSSGDADFDLSNVNNSEDDES